MRPWFDNDTILSADSRTPRALKILELRLPTFSCQSIVKIIYNKSSFGECVRKIALLFLCSTIIAFVLLSQKDNALNAAAEKRAFEKNKAQNVSPPLADIVIEINHIVFQMPRKSGIVLELFGGTIYEDLHKSRVDFSNVSRIQSFQTPKFRVSDISSVENFQSEYDRVKDAIENVPASKTERTLINGIREISGSGSEILVLPSGSKTKDKKPVVFLCTGSYVEASSLEFCRTSYVHPLGFSVSYQFRMSSVPKEEVVTYDNNIREQIKSLIISPK